jgi:outer membrane receptor protein involved in Fe transport
MFKQSAACRIAQLTVVLFLALFSLQGLAQLPTATILGTVKDPSGSVMPNAAVRVRNIDQNLTREVTTGADGGYRLPALPVGSYEIQISHEGFSTITRTGVVLTVNQDAVLNFTMQVGTRNENVQVNAAAPMVDTASSEIGSLVSEQKINELPLNGRNMIDLTLLQPGVAQFQGQFNGAGEAGTVFVVNGSPTRSNNQMLDGAIMQNFYGLNASSVNSTTLGAEGIKEYQVVTSQFSAEYGMTMGSQTTIVSKSGTNKLHGSAFEYLRNDALDARNYFDELYSMPPTSPGGGQRLPPFHRNQFGGSLGGPIKKDKTFIFGTFESVRENLGESLLGTVFPSTDYNPVTKKLLAVGNPDATFSGGFVNPVIVPFLSLFPYPNVGNDEYQYLSSQNTREEYGMVRVDHSFSTSDSFFTRYTIDNTFQNRPYFYPQRYDTWSNRSQYVTLSETHIFSPTLLNTARFSVSRTGMTTTSTSGVGGPDLSFVAGQDVGLLYPGTATSFGPDISPGYHKQNIYTLSDDLFWTKGKHALKFGTLLNKFGQGIQENYLLGGFAYFASNAMFFANLPIFYEQSIGNSTNQNRYYRFGTYGFYVQDDYRASSRLTLNLGLRYEPQSTPREMNGREWRTLDIMTASSTINPADAPAAGWTQGPVMQNHSLHNFSPRFGLAWDPLGNGKTAIRGGFGVYYDVGNEGSVLGQDTLGTPPLVQQYYAGMTMTPFGPQFPAMTIPFTYGPTDVANGIVTVDYYAKQPYSMQWNLSVQQQLPGNTALTAAYIGSRGVHLWGGPTFVNSNTPIGWTDPGVPIFNPLVMNRVNPNLGVVIDLSTHGDSYYNGLQVTLTNRVSHGLQFSGSYTYSKSEDNTQSQLSGADGEEEAYFTDPYSGKFDKGPSAYDLTHVFNGTMTYRIPNNHWDNFAGSLMKGWQLGNIVSIQSGYPYSVMDTGDNANLGWGFALGGNRASLVTPANLAAAQAMNPCAVVYNASKVSFGKLTPLANCTIPGDPTQLTWYNFNMFTAAPAGELGDSGRNIMRGPGLVNWNFSVMKETHLPFLGDAGNLQFRAEFFNLLNHTNFGLPNGSAVVTPGEGAPNSISNSAGAITYAGTSREIQFALRLVF